METLSSERLVTYANRATGGLTVMPRVAVVSPPEFVAVTV